MIEGLGRLAPNTQRIILIACGILLYMVWFARVPITEIDEVRYTEATREMLASGNYLIPHFNGEPRYQKPILYYWIQSASVRALGVNEFAARLPSALIALALVLLLHAFLLRWLTARAPAGDPRAWMRARGSAFLGAFALATMPLIAIWARAATTDITLTFFIAVSLLAMLQADLVRAKERDTPEELRQARRWYLLAAGAAGLAFLTKGPMGLVLPGLAWIIYHARQRNLATEARRLPWIPALLIFLAVAAPWYIATYLYDGPGFLKHFFLAENIGRYATIQEGHGAGNRLLGLVLYFPIAIISLFPYSPFVMRDLWLPFAGDAGLQADDLFVRMRRFAWAWIWAIIGFFALSKTQLPSYIQAIAPAAAILFALQVMGRTGESRGSRPEMRRGKWVELVTLFVLAVLFIAAPVVALLLRTTWGPLGEAALPQPLSTIVAVVVAPLGVIYLAGLFRYAIRDETTRLISWTAIGWGGIWCILVLAVAPPIVSAGYQYSVDLGAYLRQQPADIPVFYYSSSISEDIIYYSQRDIKLLPAKTSNPAAVARRLSAVEGSMIILTDSDSLQSLPQTGPMTVLKRAGNILILRRDNTPRTIPR